MKKKALLMLTCLFVLGAWLNPLCAYGSAHELDAGNDGEGVWVKVIKDVGQLSTNSNDLVEGIGLAALIDGDGATLFHTVWHTDMGKEGLSEEEWLNTLASNASMYGDVTNTDAGYHFIQVNAGHAVNRFKFQYKGQNSRWWHDNPNHILVYATNDDALGARATYKDVSQWTLLKDLEGTKDNFADGNVIVFDPPYESPEIETEEGYKYFRFVVTYTSQSYPGFHKARVFNSPEVTGITFQLSEFQMFEFKDPGYVVWKEVINAPSQLSANSCDMKEGGGLENLIDKDVNTIFHTVWDVAMKQESLTEEEWLETLKNNADLFNGVVNTDAGYHFIQVNANHAVKEFKFMYQGQNSRWWHDNPNHITVYATNDDELGARATNKDTEKWTLIKDLEGAEGNFAEGNDMVIDPPYTSPLIKMAEGYKYFRFVVKYTSQSYPGFHKNRIYNFPEITGITFQLSEFQLLEPVKTEDYSVILPVVVDSIAKEMNKGAYQPGTNPGYVLPEAYTRYENAMDNSINAMSGVDNEEMKACCKELRDAFADLSKKVVKVETGYYFIESAYYGYANNQGVTKSMCINSDKQFCWNTTNHDDPTQLWYIEKLENGKYSIKNVASNEYVGKTSDDVVGFTENQEVEQEIYWYEGFPGQFGIKNVVDNVEYHTCGHGNGAGINGLICLWEGGPNGASSWAFMHETDQELIDRLTQQGAATMIQKGVEKAMKRVDAVTDKVISYPSLVTDGSQIASNAQSVDPSDESSFENLLDGDKATIFHSIWDNAYGAPMEVGDGPGWHNLQFTLKEPVSGIRFFMQGRYSKWGYHDNPEHVTVYATNDDVLGASTANADSAQWVQVADFDHMLTNESYASFTSPEIDFAGESYKYLRFVVKHTTTQNPGCVRADKFATPQVSGVTFNLSEMRILSTEIEERSQYIAIPGVKEAYDAMVALVKEINDKVAAGKATDEDVKALNAAIDEVEAKCIDREGIYNKLGELLEKADGVYNDAIGARVPLINDMSQLSANSIDLYESLYGDDQSKGDKAIANLIDNDLNTIVHSVYNKICEDPNITEADWENLLASDDNFRLCYGAGYHNLQVALEVPKSEFFFNFYSTGGVYHDQPDDIEIYATNDAELASDLRDSNTPQWTYITRINEGIPTGLIREIPYTSPAIKLGEPYKYIRFVFKHTVQANKEPVEDRLRFRTFVAPDITGYVWNLAEFQMFSGLDPESVQYNYIPEVHDAADALKAVTDKYKKFSSIDIVSEEPLSEIQGVIDALQKAYVDTTDVVNLYKEYKSYALNAEEGENPGCVDEMASVEAYDAALDAARATVSLKQPTHEQCDQATEQIKAAYAEFVKHIVNVEPYVWYNIKTATDREYGIDQPIFLNNSSVGADLNIGEYPYPGVECADVNAIWRLVPVEGAEGQYAIQNLGTGQYFGPYRGEGDDSRPLMSHEKVSYEVAYTGGAAFSIRQADIEDRNIRLKADGHVLHVLYWHSNTSRQQDWKFERVDANSEVAGINDYPANNVGIITLPFAVTSEDLSSFNPSVEAYTINNLTSADDQTTLTLSKKAEFSAGEPFVLINNTEVPDENGHDFITFALPAAEADAMTDAALTVNGMVGTLEGVDFQGSHLLYFENAQLCINKDASVFTPGRGGYIDATAVKDMQGSIDKTITISGMVNGVEEVKVEDAKALVDVYTLDGVLVKHNVKAAEATKNLAKGIYIVGKKKVLVK